MVPGLRRLLIDARLRRVAIVVAAGAAAVLVAVLLGPPAAPPTPVPAPAALAESTTAPDRAGADAPPGPAPVAALPAPAGADEVEICGGAWVRIAPDGRIDELSWREIAARALAAAREATLATMLASPDPEVAAAAHFYAATRADLPAPACEDASCAALAAERAATAASHREALARLAQASIDPQVYAWAVRSCRAAGPAPGGFCQLVNAGQWARLDDANAGPWLEIAGQAAQRHDVEALDDALFHAASAARQDARSDALATRLIEHAPPGDADLLGTYLLAIEARSLDAASALRAAPAVRTCEGAALVDANRRETCNHLAELLVERSGSLRDRRLGATLARRLQWPEERLQRLADERDALRSVAAPERPSLDPGKGCAALRADVDRLAELGRLGEVAFLRQRVEASGRSEHELALALRGTLVARNQRAPAEDEAASAPPSPYSEGPPPGR